MKKNLKVIQINGFRGLFLTLFIISCLIAGFIAFPAFLAMNLWNYLAIKTGSFPSINFGQGVLLWAIITFSIFLINKRKFVVSFNTQQELDDEEVKAVISRIKSHAIKNQMLQSKDINISTDNKEEVKEVTSDHKEN